MSRDKDVDDEDLLLLLFLLLLFLLLLPPADTLIYLHAPNASVFGISRSGFSFLYTAMQQQRQPVLIVSDQNILHSLK